VLSTLAVSRIIYKCHLSSVVLVGGPKLLQTYTDSPLGFPYPIIWNPGYYVWFLASS